MIWFKARHEVKQLRTELSELREMLRTHFNIKYTFNDFQKWFEEHDEEEIPTSVGEFLHYFEMLDPCVRDVYFRARKLKPETTDVE